MSRLSIGFRIKWQDPGHTHFSVFAALAREEDDREWADITRANAGSLTLRTDEFEALAMCLENEEATDPERVHIDIYRDPQGPHPCLEAVVS